ncbi:MAG TPA: cation diffusion facilitator family transporter [Acidimicrobiia bacterium]|nr:cation diffusion facilitator family transporter [Acidimicrobiia bacterium]
MQEGSRRAVIAAFLANFGIAIAKFVGFALTGAASLLAEAVHSVADTSNQGLLFLGGRRGQRPATPEHPFGYGRERYFWAFVVSVVLFLLGGLFALYEGVEKLRHPHEVESLPIAIAILLVAIVFESFALRTAVREASKVRGTESWWQFVRRSKSPELPVILLEDTGALLGLAFALSGVTLARITHEPRFDAVGSLAIGALLVVIAVILAMEMRSLLIGEAPSPKMQAEIERAINGANEVRRIIHIRTMHLGPDELLVAAKVDLDAPSVPDVAKAIDVIEARVRAAVPIARVVYIEPDLYRSKAAAPAEQH